MSGKGDSIDHNFFSSENEGKKLNSTFTKSTPDYKKDKVHVPTASGDTKVSSTIQSDHDDEAVIRPKMQVSESQTFYSTHTHPVPDDEAHIVRLQRLQVDPPHNKTINVRVPSSQGKKKDEHFSDDSTDSVTDVSPLSSPNQTPRVQNKKTRPKLSKPKVKGSLKSHQKYYYSSSSESELSSDAEDKQAKKLQQSSHNKKKRKELMKQRNELSMHNHRQRLLDVAAQNSMDLSQLLEVILTMNEGKYQEDQINDPFKASLGPPQPRAKNHSFTNQQAYEIDRENQRLLKELARANRRTQSRPGSATSSRSSISSRASSRPSSSASGYRPASSSQPRLYHAGRNRIREQQRIEKENLALLKRLQSAKSDKNVRRKKLLDDYKRQTNYMSNSISSAPGTASPNKSYHKHLQKHGFSPSKPEWQS